MNRLRCIARVNGRDLKTAGGGRGDHKSYKKFDLLKINRRRVRGKAGGGQYIKGNMGAGVGK